MRRSAWRGRLLLALLVGTYPAAFFASNNWYAFGPEQIGLVVLVVPLATVIGLGLLASGLALIGHYAARLRSAPAPDGAIDAICAAASLGTCFILSWQLLAALAVPPVLLGLGIGAAVLACAAWARYRGLRGINVGLSLLLAITALQWVVSWIRIEVQLQDDLWHGTQRDENERIHFVRTPNVYYLVAESYPSRAALRTIFEINHRRIYQLLEARGFEVHHRAFSNYSSTITSLSSLFAMNHHYARTAIGELDSFSGRDVISARVYNAVVDIFRRNGYAIQYIHEYNYQVRRSAPIDYLWPAPSRFAALEGFLPPLFEWAPMTQLTEVVKRRTGPALAKDQSKFMDRVEARIEAARDSDRPYFTYLYIIHPGHSLYRIGKFPEQDALIELRRFRRGYPKKLAKANRRIVGLIDAILSRDHDALIVLGGDHGAWGHRVIGTGKTAAAIEPRTIALDRLGILLALRFPADYDGRFAGQAITNVNLFRYIFAYLAGDDAILETRVADDGFFFDKHLVRGVEGGRLLETPVPFDVK